MSKVVECFNPEGHKYKEGVYGGACIYCHRTPADMVRESEGVNGHNSREHLSQKTKEELKSGGNGGDGFTDWNTKSLDELADYLERRWQYQSSGEAKAIFELIKFYRENK